MHHPVLPWLRTLAAAALCLGVGSGCHQHKGFVLRGDWSLELNRVPHLTGHGASYEGVDACPPSAQAQAGYGDGGPIDPATGLPLAVGPRFPRFHPVPTRPVFESASPIIGPGVGSQRDGPLASPPDEAPRTSDPAATRLPRRARGPSLGVARDRAQGDELLEGSYGRFVR